MQGEIHSSNFKIKQFDHLDNETEKKCIKNISESYLSPESNNNHESKSFDPNNKHCWMKASSAANYSEEQNFTLES